MATISDRLLQAARASGSLVSKHPFATWTVPERPSSTLDRLVLENPLVFKEHTGLGQDFAYYFQHFLRFRRDSSVAWWHLSVPVVEWPAYVQAMEALGKVVLLPFWCLCRRREGVYRHAIVVTQQALPYVKGFQAYRLWRVEQWIDVVAYVTQARSCCGGSKEDPSGRAPSERDDPQGHFYVARETMRGAQLAMLMLLPNGLQRFFRRVLASRPLWKMVDRLERRGGAWSVPIGVVRDVWEGLQFPLADAWVPGLWVSVEDWRRDLEEVAGYPFWFVSKRRVVVMKHKRMAYPEVQKYTSLDPTGEEWNPRVLFESMWDEVSDMPCVLSRKQQAITEELMSLDKVWKDKFKTTLTDAQDDFEIELEAMEKKFQNERTLR